MNLQCIAEHTVDIDLLSGGVVIDAGCLGFGFSDALAHLNCDVYAFDVQSMDSNLPQVKFTRAAISNYSGVAYYKPMRDKQACHLSDDGIEVGVIDLNKYMSEFNTPIDVLKLDIEGTEYIILSDPEFNPLPRQITVEFHEHAHKALHETYFDICVANLIMNGYVPVKHDRYAAHGAGMNYWDSLFIRKDLL